jgi:hypothetical protein
MIGAEARRLREIGQVRGLIRCLDGSARLGDLGRIALGQRRLVGLAPLARAEARPLGLGAARVEAHVLRVGQPRRAGRPAIDARGRHRIEEPVVGRVLARHDGGPARVAIGGGSLLVFTRALIARSFLVL